MSYAEEIEKKVVAKMTAIKLGNITPKESGIAAFFNKLKTLDKAAYEKRLEEYKKILADRK